jgi:monoterpene epsilon-lactone hydrolase
VTVKQAIDSEAAIYGVFAALNWVNVYHLPWAWCTRRVPSRAKCWFLNLLFRTCFQSVLLCVRCLRWARRQSSPQSSRSAALTRIMRVLLKPRQKMASGKLELFRQPAMRLVAPAKSDDLVAVDSLETVDARAKPRYVWIARKSLRPEQCRRVVFYIHGGGFAKGDLAAFHRACATYSAELNALVAFPLYGLCPENTLEQAVGQLGTAYRSVRLQFPAMPLVMMADSAGGLLAVLLARTLQEGRIPLPQALVLFSPLLDLSLAALSVSENGDRDPLLDSQLLEWVCSLARQNVDPQFVTVNWTELSYLPRTHIVACADELLVDDSRRLESALSSQHVPVKADYWIGLCHAFPLLYDHLPEAKEAIARVRVWLDEQDDSKADPRDSLPASS